jgi:oxygen-independent coproporphyrinogen-3 oxidase
MTTPRPIPALYVHVPFCRSLCGYCDFYSQVADPAAMASLVDALVTELGRNRGRYEVALGTIYVGGGTPTILPPTELARLLDAARAAAGPRAEIEFTVEANPATVSPQIAEVLAQADVNRVSIGAQSFEPAELRVLERTHTPPQVAETVETCRQQGIRQINLDLIFAIPGQSLASWLATLDAALTLQPDHFSCYGLTYEPGTRLHQQLADGLVERVDADVEADMYEAAIDRLAAAGYQQYEISNFARPGRECRHNLTYWHNEPYLGVGPSAAGFVDGVRYKNVPDTTAYVKAVAAGTSPWIEQEQLTPERRACETAMLELRLTEGMDRRRFRERFGDDPVVFFADAIRKNVALGLLEVDDRGIRLTRAGLLLADSVIADFL